ncbi:uncharacterized protein LOC110830188 isoform X3 [Zootermopsis nevadensis]|uniref:uncharacterized protein LOC110830188 isoform X3 n=1 Tax=Zootermopsis nevadensis TaxID=136037 RepID=UPI000B8E5312|nr:uncharacterized protein LOC110830188 isoform X3 [Zootermopsis nevadensis]XP_021920469.1 uncharacterized protein LOC110830188 isoform X3 [Zootermopsis nevadensis]
MNIKPDSGRTHKCALPACGLLGDRDFISRQRLPRKALLHLHGHTMPEIFLRYLEMNTLVDETVRNLRPPRNETTRIPGYPIGQSSHQPRCHRLLQVRDTPHHCHLTSQWKSDTCSQEGDAGCSHSGAFGGDILAKSEVEEVILSFLLS